jgi:hypothetical protein
MKKVEIILGLSSIIAIAVNLLSAKSSNVFLVLLLFSTSVFYLYISFVHFNSIRLSCTIEHNTLSGMNLLRMAGTIMIGFSLSATTIGMAFVFLAWSGANLTLGVGLLGLFIGSAIGFIMQSIVKSNFYNFVFKRIAIFGFLGLILLLFPKETWVEIKYRNHPTYVEAIKKDWADPTNNELWKKADKEKQLIVGRD